MGETQHRPVICTTETCPHFGKCVQMPSSNYLNNEGKVDVVIVGQGAGWQEEHNQRSWCGKAGQLLRNILRDIRQDHMWDYGISLTNTVRCRPTEIVDGRPTDRPPTKDELDTCLPYLMRDITELHPKVILAMGASSCNALGLGDTISKARGKVQDFTSDGVLYKSIATFHPAGVLRQPGLGKDMRKDIELAFTLSRTCQKE